MLKERWTVRLRLSLSEEQGGDGESATSSALEESEITVPQEMVEAR